MRSWPHAPSRSVTEPGTYILTSATYHKEHLFADRECLDHLTDTILETALEHGWQLQAWAIFPNHYHLVGFSDRADTNPRNLAKAIHGRTGQWLNKRDGCQGRMVWYRTWDTHLTYERSYLARLRYVHENAVKHRLVAQAENYPWCSAKWFEDRGERPFVKTVMSFPIDGVKVVDDFDVELSAECLAAR